LVHAKSKTDITKTKDNQEKPNNTKHRKKTSLVYSLLTTLGQETRWGLFYNASEPTRGVQFVKSLVSDWAVSCY